MRLHFSLGHVVLNLTICEPDDPSDVHELTADTEIPTFGFVSDDWTEPDPEENR